MEKTGLGGVTPTERFLAELCGRCFLRLWSYTNPFKDDGHEFCDVIAVFEKHVFIFFDRKKQLNDVEGSQNIEIRWLRWKRITIDKQVNTARGAERYLRSGRKIYLDIQKTKELPLSFDIDTMVVHKIIVAHGAAQACKNFSESNIYGSLAICYGQTTDSFSWPFMINLDKNFPIHVFDTHNLPIILGELDTIKDFSDYLDAKVHAICTFDMLCYCGEEDLLAHYWTNFDRARERHYIGTDDQTINGVLIGEGEWHDLIARPEYVETKKANRKSYLWDEIILRTCKNWLTGTLLGHGQLLSGRGAIHEMAKEPRFMRREAVERMLSAIEAFPSDEKTPSRYLSFFNSYYPEKAYVFLQIWIPPNMRNGEEQYRAKRQEILRIACGSAKNKNPNLKTVVGIGIPPPKLEREIGEDFVWLDCEHWPDDLQKEYDELNTDWNFFRTGVRHEKKITEFKTP